MLPLSEMSLEEAHVVKALLFDLDGTFITADTLGSESYYSLERIRKVGIRTIAVTGRPAGWCDLIARWWPVDSVIGENGAFAYSKQDSKVSRMNFYNLDDQFSNRRRLNSLLDDLRSEYPDIKLASDQPFRQWDLAIDIAEETTVSMDTALEIARYCQKKGAKASISNIHVNIWFGEYNKQGMSVNVMENLGLRTSNGIYIGDSPNDSPMFGHFPLSVGVSSVLRYREIMDNHPTYITEGDGSHGFLELVNYLISTR